MTSDPDDPSPQAAPAVFLSYASEDRAAAQLLRESLPAFGLEVWYDESDLHGGDAWDQKIRNQIRECDYFMPVISANTERRAEGYFRREWRLAVERSLDMADDHIFLLPVMVDDTVQAGARVPDRFLSVQWLRVPGGHPTPALEQLCRRLADRQAVAPQAARKPRYQPAVAGEALAPRRAYPPFPKQDSGAAHFYLRVAGWAVQCGWIFFKGLPKWVRVLAYVWLGIALVSRGCVSYDRTRDADDLDTLTKAPRTVTPQPPPPPHN